MRESHGQPQAHTGVLLQSKRANTKTNQNCSSTGYENGPNPYPRTAKQHPTYSRTLFTHLRAGANDRMFPVEVFLNGSESLCVPTRFFQARTRRIKLITVATLWSRHTKTAWEDTCTWTVAGTRLDHQLTCGNRICLFGSVRHHYDRCSAHICCRTGESSSTCCWIREVGRNPDKHQSYWPCSTIILKNNIHV